MIPGEYKKEKYEIKITANLWIKEKKEFVK
jgi:hypothetical protein